MHHVSAIDNTERPDFRIDYLLDAYGRWVRSAYPHRFLGVGQNVIAKMQPRKGDAMLSDKEGMEVDEAMRLLKERSEKEYTVVHDYYVRRLQERAIAGRLKIGKSKVRELRLLGIRYLELKLIDGG